VLLSAFLAFPFKPFETVREMTENASKAKLYGLWLVIHKPKLNDRFNQT
jgi:hypothetical protein